MMEKIWTVGTVVFLGIISFALVSVLWTLLLPILGIVGVISIIWLLIYICQKWF